MNFERKEKVEKITLVKALIKNVVPTPKPKNRMYVKYFVDRPLRFLNSSDSMFIFVSEYGG